MEAWSNKPITMKSRCKWAIGYGICSVVWVSVAFLWFDPYSLAGAVTFVVVGIVVGWLAGPLTPAILGMFPLEH
jgi:hypothetical protein